MSRPASSSTQTRHAAGSAQDGRVNGNGNGTKGAEDKGKGKGKAPAQENGTEDGEAQGQRGQMPLFEMSSQFKNWRYSWSTLDTARRDLNQTAVGRVRSMLEEERETLAASTTDPAPSEVQYLTVQDELSLVAYYLFQLTRLCKAFKFSTNVESTAMTYLKRFYLRNTCMDYHPKNVMLTCLFLATKTENQMITIDNFTHKIPNCTNQDVLSLEFLVAQSLKFQFKVHHADLAGRGLMLDMQTLSQGDEEAIAHLTETVYPKASATILLLRLTDAEFLYTPSQIALAAFHLTDPSLAERWLSSKLALSEADASLRQRGADAQAHEKQSVQSVVRGIVDPIVDLVESAKKAVDVEAVREVDRRLKYCKNPEKDPDSVLFKKRAAQEEEEQQKKKQKKDDEAKSREVDPFA